MDPHCRAYVKLISGFGLGVGLWKPDTQESDPLAYRKTGGPIVGDVGMISKSGRFCYILNCFRPASDPRNNSRSRVKADFMRKLNECFKPFPGNPDEVFYWNTDNITVPESSVICAKGFKDVGAQMSVSTDAVVNVGARGKWGVSRREGALTSFPEGAYSVEIESPMDVLRDYFADNTELFFTLAMHLFGKDEVSNLCLVTGYHRTYACRLAAYSDRTVSGSFAVHAGASSIPMKLGLSFASHVERLPRVKDYFSRTEAGSLPGKVLPQYTPFIKGLFVSRRKAYFPRAFQNTGVDHNHVKIKNLDASHRRSWFFGRKEKRKPTAESSDSKDIPASHERMAGENYYAAAEQAKKRKEAEEAKARCDQDLAIRLSRTLQVATRSQNGTHRIITIPCSIPDTTAAIHSALCRSEQAEGSIEDVIEPLRLNNLAFRIQAEDKKDNSKTNSKESDYVMSCSTDFVKRARIDSSKRLVYDEHADPRKHANTYEVETIISGRAIISVLKPALGEAFESHFGCKLEDASIKQREIANWTAENFVGAIGEGPIPDNIEMTVEGVSKMPFTVVFPSDVYERSLK